MHPRKTLILTVGLPRSGKTTWAVKQGVPIVSPDQIRYALHGQRFQQLAEPFVWAIAKVMVRALFMAGHENVIVDATNGTRKRREQWKDVSWDLCAVIFPSSKETCIERAIALDDQYIVPVIKEMANECCGPYAPIETEEEIQILDNNLGLGQNASDRI